MLILTRRVNESLVILPQEGVDPATSIHQFFKTGPIELSISQVCSGRVRFGIVADPRFLILRGELYRRPA